MKYMISLATFGLLVACTMESMPEPDEGRALYAQNCAQCHGASGLGDGPLAPGMSPRPTDLTQLSRNGSFPRTPVLSTIDGYHRAALPGQQMPEFGELLTGPTVPVDTGDGIMTPTPRPLVALMAYLESIQAE